MTERTPTTKQIAKWLGILGLAYLALFASLWAYAEYSSSPFREEKKREAESVVQTFHDGYNADQIGKACEALYGCSLSSLAREGWNSYINRVRDRAGSFRTVKTSKIRISIEPFSVRATLVSSFEKGEATETFELDEIDGPLKDGIRNHGPLKIMSYQVEINGECIAAK